MWDRVEFCHVPHEAGYGPLGREEEVGSHGERAVWGNQESLALGTMTPYPGRDQHHLSRVNPKGLEPRTPAISEELETRAPSLPQLL